jgi:hypothetical protein
VGVLEATVLQTLLAQTEAQTPLLVLAVVGVLLLGLLLAHPPSTLLLVVLLVLMAVVAVLARFTAVCYLQVAVVGAALLVPVLHLTWVTALWELVALVALVDRPVSRGAMFFMAVVVAVGMEPILQTALLVAVMGAAVMVSALRLLAQTFKLLLEQRTVAVAVAVVRRNLVIKLAATVALALSSSVTNSNKDN